MCECVSVGACGVCDFVDVLHELDDEVDELRLLHLFGVEVGDEEGEVVSGHRRASEDDEVLRPLREEAREAVDEHLFDLVALLDADRDAQAVDRRLDQRLLTLIARHHHRGQQQLLGQPTAQQQQRMHHSVAMSSAVV